MIIVNCQSFYEIYIEKTPDNAIIMDGISSNVKNSSFLYVKRDIIDSINSTINMKTGKSIGNQKKLKVKQIIRSLKTLYETVVFDRYAEDFARKNGNIHIVDYDRLISDRQETLNEIMAFLNLPLQEGLGKDLKPPVPTREKLGSLYFLNEREQGVFRTLYKFFHLMPMPLLRMENFIYLNLINRKYKRIPPNF